MFEALYDRHLNPNIVIPAALRVLIVDDQENVREALNAFLLAYGMDPVGEASTGTEAVRLCEQYQPDVVLMDLRMSEMDGATATKMILQRWPQTRVIALTSFEEDDLLRGALEAGAANVMLKNASAEEIACAIQATCASQNIQPPRLS